MSKIFKYSQLDVRYKRRSHNIFRDILEQYSEKKFPQILEVGCASGIIGMLRCSSNNIFGIERDIRLCEQAKENCEKVYQMDLNDFKSQNIEENLFDFIFCGDVLEHLVYPEKVLKELILLLSENGYVVVSLPNIAQIQFRLMLLFGRFNYSETGVLDKTHLHFYTFKTGREMIERAGLRVQSIYPSGTIVSFINILPSILSSQFVFLCKKC